MLKKIMASMLVLGMIIMINPISANVDESNVQDAAVSDTFSLSHTVTRISKFKTTVIASTISEAGDTQLGSFSVDNNTLDGFSLTIESAKGGILEPTGTTDGEADIQYAIKINATGQTGVGLDTDYAHSSADLATGAVDILSMAGSAVSSATDADFELVVSIDDAASDIMAMAGTYSDTLTLTYTDL